MLPEIKSSEQVSIANLVNMVGKTTQISSQEAAVCHSLQKILKTLQPTPVQKEYMKAKLNAKKDSTFTNQKI